MHANGVHQSSINQYKRVNPSFSEDYMILPWVESHPCLHMFLLNMSLRKGILLSGLNVWIHYPIYKHLYYWGSSLCLISVLLLFPLRNSMQRSQEGGEWYKYLFEKEGHWNPAPWSTRLTRKALLSIQISHVLIGKWWRKSQAACCDYHQSPVSFFMPSGQCEACLAELCIYFMQICVFAWYS